MGREPGVPAKSRWIQRVLVRDSGTLDPKKIVIFERVDSRRATVEARFRVWCNEFVERDNWIRIRSLDLSDSRLLLNFPIEEFVGLPPALALEIPKVSRLGGIWRLWGQDQTKAGAEYMLRSEEEFSAKQVADVEARYVKQNAAEDDD